MRLWCRRRGVLGRFGLDLILVDEPEVDHCFGEQ